MSSIYVPQVGGNHYQSEYQHWDFVIECQLPYLEAQTSRYISRCFKKNGLQDLEKCITYLNKTIKASKTPVPEDTKPFIHKSRPYLHSYYDKSQELVDHCFKKFLKHLDLKAPTTELNDRAVGILAASVKWRSIYELEMLVKDVERLHRKIVEHDKAAEPSVAYVNQG